MSKESVFWEESSLQSSAENIPTGNVCFVQIFLHNVTGRESTLSKESRIRRSGFIFLLSEFSLRFNIMVEKN